MLQERTDSQEFNCYCGALDAQVASLCTCENCVAGYISPRMRWLLLRRPCLCNLLRRLIHVKGYSEIFGCSLPRTCAVFECTLSTYRKRRVDISDLDIYGELEHMPLDLRCAIRRDIRVMNGYTEVFRIVNKFLNEYREPTSSAIDQHIRYSYENEDAKLFLEADGEARYALQYLINMIKDTMVNRNGLMLLEEGLAFLPRCANDEAYDTVGVRLLQ
ncbi:hypothetical protein F5884DRAFT_839036 [Xylogone sp. PMI_703]|nr:hypothetical protein F5884DRAFT_839036 [Xylogone sp. PMI_703]